MRKNKFIIFGVSICILVSYFLYIQYNWNIIKNNIPNITIADIFNNITTLFLGVVVSFVFGVHHSNKQKQAEIISNVLDMYLEDLKYIMRKIKKLVSSDKLFTANYDVENILHTVRLAHNDLHIYIELLDKTTGNEKCIKQYKKEFLKFRTLLTEQKFKDRNDLSASYYKIFNSYYSIKNSIQLSKYSYYE